MTTFAQAVQNQTARTQNGMKALKTTGDACTNLFFNIGAMRGKDPIPAFVAAYAENPEYATRIALWARDVRSGAGERKIFRDILAYLSKNEPQIAERVLNKVPALGRWDDVFAAEGDVRQVGFQLIREALKAKNGLAAKWMPRKGPEAVELRAFLGMTPKQYRKTLVTLTNVVEQDMCANKWDDINFNHVPSVASSRYKKAFNRRTPEKYKAWTEALVSTDPKVRETVKVNAGAVYPYDVLKGLCSIYYAANYGKSNLDHIKAQWEALPNYVGEANILPLVDVSGSMTSKAAGYSSKSVVTCLDVAVSLGLYLADKNKGKFKDTFLTFSSSPELVHLKGDIIQKVQQMSKSHWTMSTNLVAALDKILSVAVSGGVPQEEMPEALLIISDMQFNQCARFDDTAMQMIERKYKDAGYDVPKIVFWNLNSSDNVPVAFDKSGVALVSGFSTSIVKAILSGELEEFSPEGIMLKTIMNERYDF